MKTLFDLTTEVAEAASVSSPTPPLYDVVLSIYEQLGGSQTDFLSIYDILQAMLDEDLVSGGGITPSGVLEILTNGTYDVTQYASASVSVPQGVFPSGNLNITENGEYEVRNYDSASVDVPQPEGSVSISENGSYDVAQYASASISVPQGIFPSGNLNITENGNYEVAGYESASVSVSGGGGSVFDDLANAGYSAQDIAAVESLMQRNVDYVGTLYEDTSEVTSFSNRFSNNRSLIYVPKLNTSNVTFFNRTFYECRSLMFVPPLDLHKATDVQQMFLNCSALEVVSDLDLSGIIYGSQMSAIFSSCLGLVSVGKINVSSAEGARIGGTGTGRPFYDCKSLKDMGGFTGLKISIDLQDCPNLTLQSVTNILTEAADLTGQTGATLTLHADAKARLTQAEYDLAASKNWTIA